MSAVSRILVVDDEEQVRSSIQTILVGLGYTVNLAQDGEEGLAQATAHPPDLVLLDVEMPRLNGLDVCRRLKNQEGTRHIPVLILATSADAKDRAAVLEAGADDLVWKPVETTELTARVRLHLKLKAYGDSLMNYQREMETTVSRRTAELQQALGQLKDGFLETILRLSRAAEFKDPETGSHIERISRYVVLIARAMELDAETVELLRYAAPMHDLGKIGIPDHILLKPGKLDREQWEVMKHHTVIGARILGGSNSPVLQTAEIIALTHHEKWDGSGYPRGLTGTETPLAGRITGVADVYDALTSRRPYKEPFSPEESFRWIKDARGQLFDPDVIDAFLGAQREIVAVRDEEKKDLLNGITLVKE